MHTLRTRPQLVDNRLAYLGFALAYVLGHGAAALRSGGTLELPSWLPMAVLGAGLALGTVAGTVTAIRAQRSMTPAEAGPARLLGMVWVVGFAGLFLLITGLTRTTGDASLQNLLWPVGSAFVVGLIYLAEGAMRRDTLHYVLGIWLVLLGGVALLLPVAGALTVLAVAGGGAYLLATGIANGRVRAARA